MTVSEKIFELLEIRGMSRKEFSARTGIALSTIADWKRKKTNPVSDKIMIICDTLGIAPEELLSGNEGMGTRSRANDYYVISKDSDIGIFLSNYYSMDDGCRKRLEGYMEALMNMQKTSRS